MEYGSSLLVPSVQELVKEPIITVPSRYIRPDQYDKTSNKIISVSEIPVINFQNLLCHGELSESELASLHSACRDWGFFQVLLPFFFFFYESKSFDYLYIFYYSVFSKKEFMFKFSL